MKRYISLASALMVGTVLAQDKQAVFTQELAPVTDAVQTAAVAPVVATAKARAVYVSENTTEHDLVDSIDTSVDPGVQVVNDQATSVTSQDAGTSAESVVVRVNSATTTANDAQTSEGTSADEVQSHEAPTTENDAQTSVTSNVDNLPVADDDYVSHHSNSDAPVETSVETSNNPETTPEDKAHQDQEWTSAETSANPETTPADQDEITSHCDDGNKDYYSQNDDQYYTDDNVTYDSQYNDEITSHCDENNYQGEEEHWTEKSYYSNNYQGEEEHWTEKSYYSNNYNNVEGDRWSNVTEEADFGGVHAGYHDFDGEDSYHTAYVEEVQSSVTSHDVEDGVTSCDFEEEGIYYKSVDNQTQDPVVNTSRKDHGFVGKCGAKMTAVQLGDYFWCDDFQANLRTQCQKVAQDQYVCCARDDGCDDVSDLKIWYE